MALGTGLTTVKLGVSKPLPIGFGTKRPMQADRAWETPAKWTRDLTPRQRSGRSVVTG